MKCRNCQYRLWNLRERRCPECGTTFLPSDFEFVPNTVEFCCPHCEQPYYGTDARGHLEPRDFHCVRCGRFIRMDEMVLRPAGGVDNGQTTPFTLPWLDRRELGHLRAWLGTTRLALLAPTELMQSFPADESSSHVWKYALVTATAGTLPTWLLCMGWAALLMSTSNLNVSQSLAGILLLCGLSVLLVLLFLLFIACWSGTTHLLLRLTGRTPHPLRVTTSAIGFSSGTLVVGIAPCLGAYLMPFWWLISAVLSVRQAQHTSTARAIFAVAAPPVTAFLLLFGTYAGLIWYLTYQFQSLQAGVQMTTQPTTTSPSVTAPASMNPGDCTDRLLHAWIRNMRTRGSDGPEHALQLFVEDSPSAPDSPLMVSELYPERPLWIEEEGFIILSDDGMGQVRIPWPCFLRADADKRRLYARLAAAALPAEAPAHRLGDFVFTCPGTNMASAPGELWLVIYAPLSSADHSETEVCFVGRADGSRIEIPAGQFDQALAAQNLLRAHYRLPLLPSPWRVGNDGLQGTSPAESLPAAEPSPATNKGRDTRPRKHEPGTAEPPDKEAGAMGNPELLAISGLSSISPSPGPLAVARVS